MSKRRIRMKDRGSARINLEHLSRRVGLNEFWRKNLELMNNTFWLRLTSWDIHETSSPVHYSSFKKLSPHLPLGFFLLLGFKKTRKDKINVGWKNKCYSFSSETGGSFHKCQINISLLEENFTMITITRFGGVSTVSLCE